MRALILLALLASPAFAEDDQSPYLFPVVPDEATKIWALKRAYQLNGNSMVGNNRMIDLSNETPFANPVTIERITVPMPRPAPSPEAQLAQMVPVVADICKRHGKRRVATHGGRSWRCR